MNDLPVSIYFTPEWWDRYYHNQHSRPQALAEAALEAMYLGRLRFLFNTFREWGLGAEQLTAGAGQIATVIRYGFDLVPVLLGTQLDFVDAWGFYPRFRTLDDVRTLRPVDIAQTADGDWLLAQKERLVSCYGGCSHCVDLGSVTNNAFRMLGEDVYAEALADPAGLQGLFEVILETQWYLYRFLSKHFGPQDPVPVSNCNVSLLGPATYERTALPYDIRQGRFFAELTGEAPRAAVHHCDVKVDAFLRAYAQFPGLASLQASFMSDIAATRAALPGVTFSALISPAALNGDTDVLRKTCERTVAADVSDFAMWNVDAETSPARLHDVLTLLGETATSNGRRLRASALPLCWDELEWAHGRYQG